MSAERKLRLNAGILRQQENYRIAAESAQGEYDHGQDNEGNYRLSYPHNNVTLHNPSLNGDGWQFSRGVNRSGLLGRV